MIHSLSGGVLDGDGYHNLVKVEVDLNGNKKTGYYLCDEFRVAVGNEVAVEDGDGGTAHGKVVRVDKNVSEKCMPIAAKRALRVISLLEG